VRQFAIVALVFALLSGMAFAGGQDDAGSSTTTLTNANDGEPVYGGTFTITPRAGNKPTSPDPMDNQGGRTWYTSLIQETPMIGDFETYGPRGTGEWDFKLIGAIPEKFWKGLLITDWEVTPQRITWTVRDGINWAPNANTPWMTARALTAADIASDLNYWREAPNGATWSRSAGDIRAEGNKVIIEFASFDTGLNLTLAGRRYSHVSPPELLVDDRIKAWENQVGTGPFMFESYVPDQVFTMVKNPNYWNTAIVKGKEYAFPFLDEFVVPIAADFSFETAAVRTGNADGGPSIYGPSWSELDRTAPDLIQDRLAISFGASWGFNLDREIWQNKQVRRALFICTDVEAYNGVTDPSGLMPPGSLPIHWMPIYPSLTNMYTPISDLPADVAELYSNDPEKAKQILAEEGYATGLELFTSGVGGGRDELLKDQWERCGVTLNISGLTGAAQQNMVRNREWDLTRHSYGAGNPVLDMPNNWGSDGSRRVEGGAGDPVLDDMLARMKGETNPDRQAAIIKEAAVYIVSQAWFIPHGVKSISQGYWPWVGNYYAEFRWINDDTYLQPFGWTWINEDIKTAMGYPQ